MTYGNMLSNTTLRSFTTNARDFICLLDVDVHPGLIVLRESGLSRQEQWDRISPVINHIAMSGDDDFLAQQAGGRSPRPGSGKSVRFRSASFL